MRSRCASDHAARSRMRPDKVGAPLLAPRASKPCTNSALESRVRLLPGLGQSYAEGPALIALYDVVSGKGAALVARPVLEGRVDTHDVLDDELNADILQIGIGGGITRVVTHGEVEQVLRRLDVRIIVDQAGECATAKIAARHGALVVHIRWRSLRVEVVRLVIHEAGHAPRAV